MAKDFQHNLKILRQNSRKSISLYYKLYAQKLYYIAKYNWKLDEDTAWELVYKTIYKVVENLTNYDLKDEKQLFNFSYTVLVNLIKNCKSSNKIEIVFENQDVIIQNEEIEQSDSTESLKIELDKLEDWERMLLLLRSQGMTYQEIAKYVDKPENHLKVYYARLKRKLELRIRNRDKE